jgi:predicted component of type VI protein secretion system
MSKRFKILLIMTIAVLILSACASNTETAQPTQTPSGTVAQATDTPVPTVDAGYPAPTMANPGEAAAPTGYPAPEEVVPPLTNTGYPSPGTFNLTLADGSEITMAVDVLNALPKENVSFDGTTLQVLALADALKQYNVGSYNQITAVGSGNSTLILTKDQISQSYLDFLPDGTIRLAVQGTPQNTWVTGLVSLKIE